MYFKDNKNGKILNVLLGIIALFIIIFIISWIMNKGANSAKQEELFKTNLENVQATAKDYFATDLPKGIGDSKVITLGEMYDLDLTEKLSYSKTDCDEDLSYMSVTKINAEEYKVKSNLVCGDKTDSLAEKIKATTVVKDQNGNVVDNKDNNTTNNDNNNNTTTDNTNNNNNNSNNVTNNNDDLISIDGKTIYSSDGKKADSCTSGNLTCSVYQIESNCTTEYEYEYKKSSASCPAGYTYSNNTCVRTNTSSIPASQNYSQEYTQTVDAKINQGGSYKVYASPNISGGNTTTYCEKGTKGTDGYCYEYANKITSTSSTCPTGYTKNGNYCYKYVGTVTNTEHSCPAGYTMSGNACYKYANIINNTTSSCPSGYTKDGNRCYVKTNVTTNTSTSCPSGYTKDGNRCYVRTNVTTNTSTSCPSGYNKEGNYCYYYVNATTTPAKTNCSCPSGYREYNSSTCYKTTNASVSYTAWGNPVRTYQTYTAESTYTYALEKKVLIGSTTRLGKTMYTYAVYARSSYYSCSSGKVSGAYCYHYVNKNCTTTPAKTTCPAGYTPNGSKCYIRKNVTTTTTTTCPTGYTKNGNYCYKYANLNTTTTTTCPTGYTKNGNACYKYVNQTTTTTTTCPTGYTKSGTTCYMKTNLNTTTTTTCPAGYTKDGNKCYVRASINNNTVTYCPDGYADGGNRCYKKNTPKSQTSALVYTCPAGYVTEGSGANTRCSVTKYNSDTYYCEDANATLVGNKCQIRVPSKHTGNSCPTGYTLSGNMCYATTTDTVSPTYTDEGTIFSKEASVPGYYRTGRAKYVTTCTPLNPIYK